MDQCMSFNIDKDDYKMLIKDLRKLLPQSKFDGFLVVMPQEGPLKWVDVELIADYCKIILRLDRRTLYVRGYSKNGDTYFWEFCDDDTPLIPGSRNLGYSGSYDGRFTCIADEGIQCPVIGCNLQHSELYDTPGSRSLGYFGRYVGGLPGTAVIERENLLLGYHPLKNAIISLAVIEDPISDRVRSATSLLTMIQMITEAARIELIAERIIENWCDALPITLQMVELENTWGTPFYQEVALQSCRRGLVSIEYVCVESINSESPAELHGTVTVEDCFGKHTVYERSLDNAESKGPGDCISLAGPWGSIFAVDEFTISVSLWDQDNEIAEGDILWGHGSERQYDILLVDDVCGKNGSVSVAYAVLREALSTTVVVGLINGDGRSQIDFYGTIVATIDEPQIQLERKLFDKSEDEYIQAHREEEDGLVPLTLVPLTRAVFPASVHSYITIQANLWGRHDILHPYDHILEGSVHFTPIRGTQFKIVTGDYGEAVRVSITCR